MTTAQKSRRICVSDVLFKEFLATFICSRKKNFKIKTRFPRDIIVVDYYRDDDRCCWWVIIESEKFKFIEAGEIIPEMIVTCETLKKKPIEPSEKVMFT